MTSGLRLGLVLSGVIATMMQGAEQKQAAQQQELKRSHAAKIPDAASSQPQSPNQSPQSSPAGSPGTSPDSSPANPRSSHRGSAGCLAYYMYECPASRKSPVMMGRTTSMSPTPRCP